MVAPLPFTEPTALDARLVTKTSLPKPKAAIALLLIFWLEGKKPSAVIYGRESGAVTDGGILDDNAVDRVCSYAALNGGNFNRDDVKRYLKGNPLFESQMESLNSAFELVWRLGTFSFADRTLGRTAERTGGIRYQKRIRFSSRLDLIGILSEPDPDSFARVLLNWIGAPVDCDKALESQLARMLSIFSGCALFKTCKGDEGTVFTLSGVYDALLAGNETVDVVDPNEEAQGTTRILKPAIGAGLFPDLAIKGNSVSFVENKEKAPLRAFAERIHVSDEVSSVKLNTVERDCAKHETAPSSVDEPRNLIFFGAPGTGKSYQLDKLAKKSFAKEKITRVTFYPDYTYSQFVGCYKPNTDENGDITYSYSAGPFLETYLRACTHPYEQYILIVEEINRANPAAVFGDVFQLLDRNADGWSQYGVSVASDMKKYIETFLTQLDEGEKKAIRNYYDPDMNFFEFCEFFARGLALPPNMYIWATMNSADQGVFPMDTAFRRRWDFRYMGIDEGEDTEVGGRLLSEIEVPCGGRNVKWNKLRHAINEFMAGDELKINEDKLLGPFFIAPTSLTPERFSAVFKDKVLLYLYEDACKTKRKKMFATELNTYAKVCDAFDSRGVGIFGDGFDKRLVFSDDDRDDDGAEE